jgi:putative ABC transport system permease protein
MMQWLETAWLDVKFGARSLRKSPVFTTVALLSLALGIGANAAIYQLLDVVWLRSLPVHDPSEIVEIRTQPGKPLTGNFQGPRPRLTNALWERIRENPSTVTDLFAMGGTNFQLSSGGESRVAVGLFVSGDYFRALEATAVTGRLLAKADDFRGCPGSAVLGYSFWKREFGGAADITNRTITLDGAVMPIAGVVRPGFMGIDIGRRVDVYVPICARPAIKKNDPALDVADSWWLAVFARLKPGVTVDQANAEFATRSRGILEATVSPRYAAADAKGYVENKLVVLPAASGVSVLGNRYGSSLTLLLAIAGLVFLIACANLANLMLARASGRAREIAVRLAIGASRARLFRQLIAESLLLAVVGALAGTLIALGLSRVLVAMLTSDGSPWALDLRIDWRLIGFSSGLATIACLLFGLTPALRATRSSPTAVLHLGGRGLTADRQRLIVRRVLVAGQVAVSVVLVVGALLFVATLRNLATVQNGFSDRGVLVVDLDLRPAGVALDAQVNYQLDVIERLRHMPGVRAAGSAAITPISDSTWNEFLIVDGQEQPGNPDANRVSPGFFEALQIPFVAGRNFDATDGANGKKVAIINQAFRDKYLASGNPIGRQFKLRVGPGEPDPFYEVVGVVGNTKYRNLREELGPQMYFPATQETDPSPFETVLLRTDASPNDLRAGVANTIRAVNPSIIVEYTVMSDQVGNSLLRERLMASLSTGFAALAIVLAAVGLYGLMAYGVARRRNEIGIRMALGATRSQVVGIVLGETAWVVAIGLVIGAVGAYYAAQSATTLLYGLSGSPIAILALGSLALALIAALASVIPAARAARLNPTVALRDS